MKNCFFTTLVLLNIMTVCLVLGSINIFAETNTKWVGTWSTAPQLVETGNNPPSPGLTNNSLRQVVRVSIGGDALRVKFSNEFSTDAVTMRYTQIAVSTGGNSINVSTNKKLKFNGKAEVTMAPGTSVTSDPIAFDLDPRMDISITIYFGQTSSTVTGHPGSRTTSYLLAGNTTLKTDFNGAVQTDHWYVINGIDVKAPSKAASIAIIGNSITDGRGSTTNRQNRWTDILSERLLQNPETRQIGVLNLGIGGNCVISGGLGPNAVSRFERDILNQQGVRWAIIYEGVNDLGNASNGTQVANDLIAAYKQMINAAHKKGILVFGATIMPFKNHSYYSPDHEAGRQLVNEWIRNGGFFDGLIDFDKIMRNPQDIASLQTSLQTDYLHPNVQGHRTMGEAVELSLFGF